MNAEDIGFELASEIESALGETAEEICANLDAPSNKFFFEYITFLLWATSKEIQNYISGNQYRSIIDQTFSATIFLLEQSDIDMFVKDFTYAWFQDFISNRFQIYYSALESLPLQDTELCEATIAHNFILLCLTDDEDLRKAKHPKREKYIRHIQVVLRHYRVFIGRIKALISRY